ncbi:MAG: hypothetical protein JSV80_09425, partial [Acidobacteriota bacterium]
NLPLAAYVTNLGALRERFAHLPLSTDDTTPIEYLSPITERESATGDRPVEVLAWLPMVDWLDQLERALPPEQDPYLARVSTETRQQVDAGRAYQRYEALRRLGRAEEARAALAGYESLLGIEPSDPS